MSKSETARELQAALSELHKLRERIQSDARHKEVIERQLRSVLGAAGLSSVMVEIRDAIPPVGDGVSLDAGRHGPADDPYGAVAGRPPASAPPPGTPWWPTAEPVRRPLRPNAGWGNFTLHGQVGKVLGISVCGLDRDSLQKIVAMITQQQSDTRDFVPLFLTDSTEFDLFRSQGFVVEYLPGPEKRRLYQGARPWPEYMAERRRLLERKWGLAHVLCFGPREFGRDSEAEPRRIAPPRPRPAEPAREVETPSAGADGQAAEPAAVPSAA